MKKAKYLILGTGPAGLAFGNALLDAGETDFLLLEAEAAPGGLCRSCEVDGSPFDIGGGHFLDVTRPDVNSFLFRFMPESEWILHVRDSRIAIGNQWIHHPIEANIWEMSLEEQVLYLKSIAQAGCNTGKPSPRRFVDWIRWKLGDRIADDYMLPYNRKLFGEELNRLGTYWLEKLPDVSFEDTLRSCLQHKAFARQPGHAQFYYPRKHGFGELWRRMGVALGERLLCNQRVVSLNIDTLEVLTAAQEAFQAKLIVSTIPWRSFVRIEGMPSDLRGIVKGLKHTSVQTEYVPKRLDTSAHWIYCPDISLSYHRILVRHNFSSGSKGYWTETNASRLPSKPSKPSQFHYLNEYAYPLNTIGKNERMKRLLDWCAARRVFAMGRWGEHQHHNSDLVVQIAMKTARRLVSLDAH